VKVHPVHSRSNRSQGLPRVGALEQWRAEIRAGTRQNTGACYDDLAAAAAWEFRALQMQASGDSRTARDYLDLAFLRRRGHWVQLQDLYTNATRELLRHLCGESRIAKRRGRATWLERNAATAAEYTA
jgi:hypothetical protein